MQAGNVGWKEVSSREEVPSQKEHGYPSELSYPYREVLYRRGKTLGNKLLKRLPAGTLPLDPYRYMDNTVGVICRSVSLSTVQKA